MLHRKLSGHKGRILPPLLALVMAVFLTSCGSGSVPASSRDDVSAEGFEIGESVQLPLVIDGDRLGVSFLDGNPPTPVSGPGYVNGVAYDAEGALVYVQHSGQEPGFYRVEDGVPRLIIPLPSNDPGLPAKWSPDASRAAWIESDRETSELVLAKPGEKPRRVEAGEITSFLWSPDSRQILAWGGWDGPNVRIIDVDTGDVEALALEGLPVAWTPAGDILIWERTSDPDTHNRQVALIHLDGGQRRVLGNIALPWEGPLPTTAFSPDGQWLSWGGMVVATDGSTSATLPGSTPTWSPDGRRLAWSQGGHILVGETSVWEGQVVADGEKPLWSPDGSKIAYIRTEGNLASLYALSLEDSSEVRVVDFENFWLLQGEIVWSPDGRQLAVPLQTGKKSDLFSFDLRSGDLQRLPIAVDDATSARLAPDGSAVVLFTLGGWTVYGFDGSSHVTPCNPTSGTFTDWSRDGRLVLCAGMAGLRTVDVRDGQVELLLEGSPESARWSPDESAVAFAHHAHTLSVLSTISGEVKDIATDLRESYAPYYYHSGSYAWSPDGRWIAFMDWRCEGSPCDEGASTVYLVGADGENLRQIIDSPGTKHDLVFSPDGRYLAYGGTPNGLVAVNVATGEETTVAATAWDATIWVNASSLLVHDPRGISIVGLDGSTQLVIAATEGCDQDLVGWSEGKLFFINSCKHEGY